MSFVSPTEWFWPWPTMATIDATIADLKKDGTKGVILKFANGGKLFDSANFPGYGYDPKTVGAILAKFKAADIVVYGWVYLYAANPDELAVAKQVIASFKDVAGWVIDVEGEFERDTYGNRAAGTREQRLTAYLKALRPLTPNLGWAPFWYPEGHAGDDYAIFSQYCDTAFPQVYWVLAKEPVATMVANFEKFWGAADATWPKHPAMVWVGDPGSAPTTAADMQTFDKDATAKGAGVSWWRFPFSPAARAGMAPAYPASDAPKPAPAPQPVPVVTPAPDPTIALKAQLTKDLATIDAQAAVIAQQKTTIAELNARVLSLSADNAQQAQALAAAQSDVQTVSALRNFWNALLGLFGRK